MSQLEDDVPPTGEQLHMPSPSLLPVLLAVGLALALVGVTVSIILTIVGLLITWFCPNRQTIMQWEWANDYLYAGVFAVLTTVCLLSMANPPAFIYFQF